MVIILIYYSFISKISIYVMCKKIAMILDKVSMQYLGKIGYYKQVNYIYSHLFVLIDFNEKKKWMEMEI